MRFFDSSAVVKLYVEEDESARVREWVESGVSVVSRLAEVEVASAFSRGVRAGILSMEQGDGALAAFRADLARWHVVELTREVVAEAIRLTRRHALRSADAIQLGSALALARASGLELTGFIAFDRQLEEAARAEGLVVPSDPYRHPPTT